MQPRLTRRVRESRLARMIVRLAEGRRGSAAVEFAMVALPFLALIMGILEISMIYLVSTTLENATADAARQIRTGQLQTAGGATSAGFVTTICGELTWLGSNCSNNLHVDVRTFASFSNITQASPIKNGVIDTTALQFTPGTAGQIVLVRAFYQWTLFTPLLDGIAAQMNGGSTLLTATAAFKNEPYSNTGT
ncbi:MAG: pilus assembly protein [Caulobacteraceae bacterium]|nr:pilus assembly protein [Caulobacteraceae bacterium]